MRAQILYPLAARTETSTATFNTAYSACLIYIDVTAVTATPSVVFTLKGRGPAGTSYDILASSAVTSTGLTVLRVHPDLTGSANAIAKDILPQELELVATHGDADSITYAVSFVGVDC